MEVHGEYHDEGDQRNYQRRPQRRSAETIEWTLEHHKQFVDTMIRLELDDLRVRTPRRTILIVELMNNEAFRLFPRSTLLNHISNFQHYFQKITGRGFKKTSAHRVLMIDFERLSINKKDEEDDDIPFSWKLEHHKKFVDAVIQLGRGKVAPIDILKLMEEERRRGLTVRAVTKHLFGLMVLQKKTQISHATAQYYAKLEEFKRMEETARSMEVDGENHDEGLGRNYQRRPQTQRSRVEAIEWTLEHHKQFVDTMIRLDIGDLTVRTPRRAILMVDLMNNEALRLLPRSTLMHHIFHFQRFQSYQKASAHSVLMRDFKRLSINKEEDLSFSWTPEYHKKLVEAVIQLGGFGKATPMGILKLVERRQGLTVQAVSKHLFGLRELQKMTQTFQEKIHSLSKEKYNSYVSRISNSV